MSNTHLVWKCSICQYESTGSTPPIKCPVCAAAKEMFYPLGDKESEPDIQPPPEVLIEKDPPLNQYLSQWSRLEYENEEKFTTIQKLSLTGVSEISPMGTRKPYPDLETILFRGAQFYRFPLNEDETASTATIIGKTAEKPLRLEIPFYVSHMSFGALSKEAKIALAMGATDAGTATCSGEGGMLPEERQHADRYIYQIGTALFSRDEAAMKKADAVEIKFGQAAKPGMGGASSGRKSHTGNSCNQGNCTRRGFYLSEQTTRCKHKRRSERSGIFC